jgi:hypothetical protein
MQPLGARKALREHAHDGECEGRLLPNEIDEARTVDFRESRRHDCNRAGSTGAAIDQGHLTEELTRPEFREDRVRAIVVAHDPYPAFQHHKHARAVIAGGEDALPSREVPAKAAHVACSAQCGSGVDCFAMHA